MKWKVLIVEVRPGVRGPLAVELENRGFTAVECACWEEARRAIDGVDAVCLGDLGPGGVGWVDALRRLRASGERVPVVMWLPDRTETLLLEALRAGAADFLKQTEPLADVVFALGASIRNHRPAPRAPIVPPPDGLARLVGESVAIRDLRVQLHRLAASDCNVLITGETGTGKDLAAELIHRQSHRSHGPLVCINCAAVPDTLLESELFGYDRGAFTGASSLHRGKLEFANRGTVFLDEIGEMTPYAQSKILRVLESRELQRLGSNATIPIDVRIIAATNQNLGSMVAGKTFRGDLFFRLSVARLHLPPLSERKQDIPALVSHYIEDLNRRTGNAVQGCSDSALRRLMEHDWPGNIRELRNLVEAIFVNLPAGIIGPGDLPEWFPSTQVPPPAAAGSDRERLIGALSSTRWNKSQAAAKLKWSRMTLYRKMKKYGVASEEGSAAASAVSA